MRGKCAEHPGDRPAEQDEAPDPVAGMAQFAEIEAQPAFEQDQRDADGNHRIEQVAEGVLGIEETEDRTGEETRRQHQDNSRPAGAPGQPLGANAQQADHRDDK